MPDVVENTIKALKVLAKASPNKEIEANDNLNNIKVICLPDIIDRYAWFSNNVAISESYAKIIIGRSAYHDSTLW